MIQFFQDNALWLIVLNVVIGIYSVILVQCYEKQNKRAEMKFFESKLLFIVSMIVMGIFCLGCFLLKEYGIFVESFVAVYISWLSAFIVAFKLFRDAKIIARFEQQRE